MAIELHGTIPCNFKFDEIYLYIIVHMWMQSHTNSDNCIFITYVSQNCFLPCLSLCLVQTASYILMDKIGKTGGNGYMSHSEEGF